MRTRFDSAGAAGEREPGGERGFRGVQPPPAVPGGPRGSDVRRHRDRYESVADRTGRIDSLSGSDRINGAARDNILCFGSDI